MISTPLVAPLIAAATPRRGNSASAAGAGRLLARALAPLRAAGVRCQVLVRADSAYYTHDFISAALRAKAWFSVTARMNPQIRAAIAGIDEAAWRSIKYAQAVWDEAEGRWISDAQVAEITITCFTSRRKADHITCRLVVRRVKRLQPLASDGTEQAVLFAAYRHHAFVTNSALGVVEADQQHRAHAIIEQVIAELKDGALAHLPSGKKTANAAWLAHAIIAFNLARAVAVAAGPRHAKTRWATVREQLINVPARIAAHSRRHDLHLPADWPWTTGSLLLHDIATAPPRAVTT